MTWIGGYAEPIRVRLLLLPGSRPGRRDPLILAWQYRRWDALDPARVWAQASWLLYLTCAWALVLMPFPGLLRPGRQPTTRAVQLAGAGTGTKWRRIRTSGQSQRRDVHLQHRPAVPVRGVSAQVVRAWRYHHRPAGLRPVADLRVTQLTANFGIYPCTYRQFNVDDLMANDRRPAGLAARPTDRLHPAPGAPHRTGPGVTVPRRALSLLIDYIGALLVALAWSTVSETYSLPLPGAPLAWTLFAMTWAVPLITGGRTPASSPSVSVWSRRRLPPQPATSCAVGAGGGPYPAVLAFMQAAGTNPTTAALVAVVLLGLWLLLLLTARLHETLSRTRTVSWISVLRGRLRPVSAALGRYSPGPPHR